MNILADSEQSRLSGTHKTVSDARIGHVNLRVADLHHATNFYCDVLGLKVVYYGPAVGLPTVFLAFGEYHHHVVLNWFYSDGNGLAHASQSALNRFAIVYPDEISLARAVARLLKHGDLIDDARDHGGTLSVYLRDPDGNGVELYYDRPRTQWFDSAGELVIKSEPFEVGQWLECVWAGRAKASEAEHSLVRLLEVTI